MNQIRQLSKHTICTLFELGSPRWNGPSKRREVGLAENRITKHNCIRFSYRRKRDGKLSFPDEYYFDGDKLQQLDLERQNRYGLMLVIVPFNELEVLVRI